MNTRAFGRTGWSVAELGMGCAGVGRGLYRKDDREALATLDRALEAGINFYDTSSSYSAGDSEQLLGRAFKGRRDRVIIASKVGMLYPPSIAFALRFKYLLAPIETFLRPVRPLLNRTKYSRKRNDFSPQHIERTLHESLARLQTDYVDLYQLHNPPPGDLRRDDLCKPLERLKAQGTIRAYGISCARAEDALLAMEHPGIACVQVPINLLDQEALPQVLPLAQARGVAVIARVPLAQGLLTDAAHETKAEQIAVDCGAVLERKRRAQALRFLATGGRTLPQAALQFVLQLPGVSVVIPGMATRRHLEENLRALDAPPLTAEELERVAAITCCASSS